MDFNRCVPAVRSLVLVLSILLPTALFADTITFSPTYFSDPVTAVSLNCNPATVNAVKDGGNYVFKMADVYTAIQKHKSNVCELDYTTSAGKAKYATVAFNNLGKFPCVTSSGANVCWAMQSMTMALADTLNDSSYTAGNNPIKPIQPGYDFDADWGTTTYHIAMGRMNFTGNVENPPATLVCNESTITAKNDAQGNYFALADLADRSNPTTPKSYTNCQLQDQKGHIYATLDDIDGVQATLPKSGGQIFWAASIPATSFHSGILNYVVTKPQGSNPAKVPAGQPESLFNQWDFAIRPLTDGSINFAGDFSTVGSKVYVTCDKNIPIELPADHKLDMRVLHDAITPISTPDTPENFSSCVLETDPTKPPVTHYATFSVQGVKGVYATDTIVDMWGALVDGIGQGQSTLYVDPLPTTTTCDKDDAQYCNQVTVNFSAQVPGELVINGGTAHPDLATDNAFLSCEGDAKRFAATPGSEKNVIDFDLQTMHGAGDLSQDVSHSCDLYINQGTTRIGSVTINAINGARTIAGTQPQPKMWSASLNGLANGLKLADPQATDRVCDTTKQYCNRWDLDFS